MNKGSQLPQDSVCFCLGILPSWGTDEPQTSKRLPESWATPAVLRLLWSAAPSSTHLHTAHTHAHTPAPSCAQSHCRHPKALCLRRRVGLTEEASEPQPMISCPEYYPLPKRPQVLPRQMLVWLQVKAGVTPSGTQLYTHPQLEGSGVLSPRPWGQLLPLAPCPLVPHSWPLTSSLLLGSQGSSSHASFPSTVSRAACPWPPGGVPGSQAGLATKQLCLTGLCWLCSACTAGLGGAGPGVPPGLLTTCLFSWWGLAAASGSCSAGWDSGSSVLRRSAAASFELPTPLWSLYMPPEETVSTA